MGLSSAKLKKFKATPLPQYF